MSYRLFTRSIDATQIDVYFDTLYGLLLMEERPLKNEKSAIIEPTAHFGMAQPQRGRGRGREMAMAMEEGAGVDTLLLHNHLVMVSLLQYKLLPHTTNSIIQSRKQHYWIILALVVRIVED